MVYDKSHFDRVFQILNKKKSETEVCRRLPSGFERELELGRVVAEPPQWALNRRDIIDKLARPGRVALTGGIASGKSTVADIFQTLGAAHIDFDLLARRAVEPAGPGFAAVVDLLGPEVVGPDGALDRPKIAGLIFSDAGLKAGLENIIHPLCWDLMGQELTALADRPGVVVSVPLLFEAGLETFFKTIVLVFVEAEIQIQRLMERQPNLGRDGARRLIDNQWPAPPKVMGSTYVLNNSGSPAEAACQAETIWRSIIGVKCP